MYEYPTVVGVTATRKRIGKGIQPRTPDRICACKVATVNFPAFIITASIATRFERTSVKSFSIRLLEQARPSHAKTSVTGS